MIGIYKIDVFFLSFVHVRILNTGALAFAIRPFHLFFEFRQFGFLVRLYEKFLQFVRPLSRAIRLAHDVARLVDAQHSSGLRVFALLPSIQQKEIKTRN